MPDKPSAAPAAAAAGPHAKAGQPRTGRPTCHAHTRVGPSQLLPVRDCREDEAAATNPALTPPIRHGNPPPLPRLRGQPATGPLRLIRRLPFRRRRGPPLPPRPRRRRRRRQSPSAPLQGPPFPPRPSAGALPGRSASAGGCGAGLAPRVAAALAGPRGAPGRVRLPGRARGGERQGGRGLLGRRRRRGLEGRRRGGRIGVCGLEDAHGGHGLERQGRHGGARHCRTRACGPSALGNSFSLASGSNLIFFVSDASRLEHCSNGTARQTSVGRAEQRLFLPKLEGESSAATSRAKRGYTLELIQYVTLHASFVASVFY
jgi:hypothetical protein